MALPMLLPPPVWAPLVRDEQGVFRMDLADMEEKIRAERSAA